MKNVFSPNEAFAKSNSDNWEIVSDVGWRNETFAQTTQDGSETSVAFAE